MTTGWNVDRTRATWWAVGLVLFGALAWVVHSFVGTFVFGLFIYYATRPLYRQLRRVVRPPSLAAAVALLVLALPALLLLTYTLAIGLQEVNRLLENVEFTALEVLLQPYIDVSGIVQNPRQILDEPNARAAAQAFLNQALGYLGFIGNALLHLFVMIGIAFYLLRDDDHLATWFRRHFSDGDGVVDAYWRAVDRDFSNIFFGNILNAALTGTIGAISYNLLAIIAPPEVPIPYPTLVGLLAGVASLVPVVGMKLVYFPVAFYLTAVAAQADPRLFWFPATFAAVSFVVVDTIPDFVLRPYVAGRGLHLGMVMFAYIFGPLLWGWYGIFLGPMLLVFIVHFVRLVLPELLAGTRIRPDALGTEIATGDEPSDGEKSRGSDEETVDGEESAEPDVPVGPDDGGASDPDRDGNGADG